MLHRVAPCGVLIVALLLAACTSGKRHAAGQQPPAGTSGTTAPAGPATLHLNLQASAIGVARGVNAAAAARGATPDMQRFLSGYLTAAFLDAQRQQRAGWRNLIAMFDATVQATARRDLDALSLGAEASKVTAVRAGPTSARVAFLFSGSHPAAATVSLDFSGTADTGQGSGPVRLKAVLQLLRTAHGWVIESYDSHTGGGP
jgi:hypothetical protein